jgi:hypothetical protein
MDLRGPGFLVMMINKKAKERFNELFQDDVENITEFMEWLLKKFGAKEIWPIKDGRGWSVSNSMLDEWKQEDNLHSAMKYGDGITSEEDDASRP